MDFHVYVRAVQAITLKSCTIHWFLFVLNLLKNYKTLYFPATSSVLRCIRSTKRAPVLFPSLNLGHRSARLSGEQCWLHMYVFHLTVYSMCIFKMHQLLPKG